MRLKALDEYLKVLLTKFERKKKKNNKNSKIQGKNSTKMQKSKEGRRPIIYEPEKEQDILFPAYIAPSNKKVQYFRRNRRRRGLLDLKTVNLDKVIKQNSFPFKIQFFLKSTSWTTILHSKPQI